MTLYSASSLFSGQRARSVATSMHRYVGPSSCSYPRGGLILIAEKLVDPNTTVSLGTSLWEENQSIPRANARRLQTQQFQGLILPIQIRHRCQVTLENTEWNWETLAIHQREFQHTRKTRTADYLDKIAKGTRSQFKVGRLRSPG